MPHPSVSTYLNNMFPIWGDDRRRKINLGGASSASSQTAILDEAKARRLEREDQRRKQINAVKLQAWWRGISEARSARKQMKRTFADDVTGITGLRCLVLIGRDEDVLGQWSSTMIVSGHGELSIYLLLFKNMHSIYM
jgi:ubiquitin-protein ligase E3 C